MKVSQLISLTKFTEFENFFNVTYRNGKYSFNLNETMYFDINDNELDEYILTSDAHWSIISYQLYNTTTLAWLLMKINKVSRFDIFKSLHAGDKIKYLRKEVVSQILDSL